MASSPSVARSARSPAKAASKQPTVSKTAGSQASDEAEEVAARVWQPSLRPAGAQPTTDANFTLEDDGITSFCETLLAGSWCAINPCEPGHPIIAVSAGFEGLTGYTAAEVLGKSSSKLLQGPRTEPQAAEALAAAVGANEASFVEITSHRKDAKPKKTAVCLVPVMGGTGVPLCLQFWVHLEDRRRAADGSSTTKWAEQVHQNVGAVCVTASTADDALITSSSSQLTALTGYSQLELAGASWLSLAGPESSSSSVRHLMSAQLGSRYTVVKVLLYKRDGSPFWALVASCPLAPADGAASAAPGSQAQQTNGAPQQLLLMLNTTASRCKRVGKYILGRVLGQGASGVVRMGRNTSTDELVAIKAVDATRFHSISEIEQVQEEMAVLAQLKHPNIIRLLEVHFLNGCFYFVMEYASGGSMVRFIYSQEGGRLDEGVAQRLFGQILSALDYCHKRRVIHRDLKPENILMEDDSVKVADFGMAGVTAPFNGSGFKLQCGTPEFTAPEIVEGREYEGTAVDLWSVGVMLYEALSGALPFRGASQAALFKAIQRGVYEPLPQSINREARDLVKRLLTVDPVSRISWSELSTHPWLSSTPAPHSLGSCSIGHRGCCSSSRIGPDTQITPGSASEVEGVSISRAGDDPRSCCGAASTRDVGSRGTAGAKGLPSEHSSSRSSTQQEEVDEVSDAEAGYADALGRGVEEPTSIETMPDPTNGPESGGDGGAAAASGLGRLGNALAGSFNSLAVPPPKRSAVSFTSSSCHESVRVVIPDSSRDDPITAAIKRSAESSSERSCDPPQHHLPTGDSGGSIDSDHSPSGRAHSFCGVPSPATPGAGGTRTSMNVLGRLMIGSTPNSGLLRPPLAPSSPTTAAGSAACGSTGRTVHVSKTTSSSSSPAAGAGKDRRVAAGLSSPVRERIRSFTATVKSSRKD